MNLFFKFELATRTRILEAGTPEFSSSAYFWISMSVFSELILPLISKINTPYNVFYHEKFLKN